MPSAMVGMSLQLLMTTLTGKLTYESATDPDPCVMARTCHIKVRGAGSWDQETRQTRVRMGRIL
jgi:hypothetical protein